MNLFPNWAKNILFLLVYMISGLVLIIIIDGLLSGADLTPLNAAIESTLTYFRTPLITNLMVLVTHVGSPFVLFATACILSVGLALRGDLYNALIFIVAISVSVAAFIVLKEVFGVARPVSDLVRLDSYSFPSGHATVATAFFFVLAHSFWGRVRSFGHKTVLALGSVLGALLVSLSRIYLGAHWTLDILGGVALGLISVSFTVLVFSIFSRDRVWTPVRKRM